MGGGPFLHGGWRDFLAKKCFFLIIRTNLKDFLSFDHFWMGGPFLQGGVMGLIFYQNFVFLLFDDSNKSEGIFEFVPFLDGGPFLHGYGGGQFFGQIYFFLFDDSSKFEGISEFRPFLDGETIFYGG